MIDSAPHLILAGGGTGGHVIPAIAVAEAWVRRGGTAGFVGTRDRLEAKLVPEAGFPIDFIEVKPIVAGGIGGKLSGLASVPPALLSSVRLLRRLAPRVVIGVGGYVAGPVVLAARAMGLPCALLEQNAAVGFTNRALAKAVHRAFVAYEATAAAFNPEKVTVTGNPIKQTIIEAAARKRRAKKVTKSALHILVMGGSQGARTIDELVPTALDEIGSDEPVRVVHQCCAGQEADVARRYADAGIKATVVPFIDDTARAYRAADLVIARSGATTVSELTVMGLPAVLIPYPHHKDQQQALNAAPMVDAGAAVVIDEKTMTSATLASAISGFVNAPDGLGAAGEASGRLGRPDAAERIVDGLIELAGGA